MLDPLTQYLKPVLQGYRLMEGRYVPLLQHSAGDFARDAVAEPVEGQRPVRRFTLDADAKPVEGRRPVRRFTLDADAKPVEGGATLDSALALESAVLNAILRPEEGDLALIESP